MVRNLLSDGCLISIVALVVWLIVSSAVASAVYSMLGEEYSAIALFIMLIVGLFLAGPFIRFRR